MWERRCSTLGNYNPNGIKNLCNAIVISAVKDARSGAITKEEFSEFIFSWWAYLLLRDAIAPDVIYKEVYPNEKHRPN